MSEHLPSSPSLLEYHLQYNSLTIGEHSRQYQKMMTFERHEETYSSSESTSVYRGLNVAIASPTSPKQPAKLGIKAKPVSLAQIRANLARKKSMEAKKRQMLEATSRLSIESSQKVEKDGEIVGNPLFAGFRRGSENPLTSGDIDCTSSTHSTIRSASTESSYPSSSQDSHSTFSKRSSLRKRKQPALLRSPVWASNIEYISNKPSSTQPVNVPSSLIANAGWDVIPIAVDIEPRRIGPILMRPESPEESGETNTPLTPTKIASIKEASHTIEQTSLAIQQASLLAEEKQYDRLSAIPMKQAELEELLQRRANSEDALLKLYDYFDGPVSPLPPMENYFPEHGDFPSSPSLRGRYVDSPASFNGSPSSLASQLPPPPLPDKAPRKKVVHFATAPNLIVTPFEDERQESSYETNSWQRQSLPSQSLERSDHKAYQTELSVIQKVRGEAVNDHQWSSDSDTSKPRNSKLKNFKDMLWR